MNLIEYLLAKGYPSCAECIEKNGPNVLIPEGWEIEFDCTDGDCTSKEVCECTIEFGRTK